MQTVRLGTTAIAAPDGSEIRELAREAAASLVHCRLPAGATSRAVCHRRVTELWYVVAGGGEIWRADADGERVDVAGPGLSLSIPPGTRFQFRAAPDAALEILIATVPAWPGAEEAVRVADRWPAM